MAWSRRLDTTRIHGKVIRPFFFFFLSPEISVTSGKKEWQELESLLNSGLLKYNLFDSRDDQK